MASKVNTVNISEKRRDTINDSEFIVKLGAMIAQLIEWSSSALGSLSASTVIVMGISQLRLKCGLYLAR